MATPISPTSGTASLAAEGLDIQSLLKIITTQLTYQDPLKPLDNFQFVSQLAQFTQLQQTAQLSDSITNILSVQGTSQAVSLLGHKVDFTSQSTTVTGTVQSISFSNGSPQLTINTTTGQTATGITTAQITQVY